jgi:diguanylate cyclase (GGDEF)-like protein/PAS domain S-box-containing protein
MENRTGLRDEPPRGAPRGPGEDLLPDYAQLLERVPAIVYVADTGADGRWDYVSPQIESILGFAPEEWRADPHLWANQLHPDDREEMISAEAMHADGVPMTGAYEYRMVHRDGRVVWIRDDAALVTEADGSRRWHGVMSDISEQKRAEAELAQRAAQQAAVARLGELALEGASATELMQEAVTCATTMLRVEVAAVLELLRAENCFLLRAGVGWPEDALGTLRAPFGETSQPGFTIVSRTPVVVPDWNEETRLAQSCLMRPIPARSGASVTIEGSGGPFGVLAVGGLEPRPFSATDLDFLQALANVLADAIERQSIEERIRHQALHDPLTGLPNRVLFADRLGHALSRLERSGSCAAVLFLDLDHFKQVNDTLGHQAGDELLSAIAVRLRQTVRTSDTVARFGGDEFGILLEDFVDERHPTEMAERIAAAFARPLVLEGSEHFVATSIGIAIARGGEQPEELIGDADCAMYRAKERGTAGYEVFDQAMRDRAVVRLRVENDLRRALERDELRLHYQPVVSLRDGRIVSAEALIRWEHPERGLLEPRDFIAVAEQDGTIEAIGRWILERACRDCASWHAALPDQAPVGVSVNVSALQFAKRSLPGAVTAALRGVRLDPQALMLEVTERTILRDVEVIGQTLREMKSLGVRLALDDFGTGYSALSQLFELPLDAVKVDRSLVGGLQRGSRADAVAGAIVAMAQALALQVIAEGVETEEQISELERLGCRLGQGYLFARPGPADEIARLLREGGFVYVGSAPGVHR